MVSHATMVSSVVITDICPVRPIRIPRIARRGVAVRRIVLGGIVVVVVLGIVIIVVGAIGRNASTKCNCRARKVAEPMAAGVVVEAMISEPGMRASELATLTTKVWRATAYELSATIVHAPGLATSEALPSLI